MCPSDCDAELLAACLRLGRSDEDLADIVAVINRAKMTADRTKYFTNQRPFLDMLASLLENSRAEPQLHLEIVLFVSSVSLFVDAAKAKLKCTLVRLVRLPRWNARGAAQAEQDRRSIGEVNRVTECGPGEDRK